MFGPAVPVAADGLQPQLMLIQVRPAVEPAMPLLLMCPALPSQAYSASSHDRPLLQPSMTAPCDKRQRSGSSLLDLSSPGSAQQSGSPVQLCGADCSSPGGPEPLQPCASSGSMDTRGAWKMLLGTGCAHAACCCWHGCLYSCLQAACTHQPATWPPRSTRKRRRRAPSWHCACVLPTPANSCTVEHRVSHTLACLRAVAIGYRVQVAGANF